MSLIIEAENITKSFETEGGSRLQLFDSLSLGIEKNKITVIVGASGAGKSTLLHVLSGLDKPDSGKILFGGKDIANLNDEELSKLRNLKMGFVFQFHHLLKEFTALENIALPMMIEGIPMKDALSRAGELMNKFGLNGRETHKPAQLSGGEQQRVAIARALINEPEIIFADEPTGNLDSLNSEMIHELFVKLKDEFNSTVLLVTHNPELMKLGDITLKMKDGKIIRE